MVVRPETVVRWHRAGWQLFWRYQSGPGRPPIREERTANELLLKLAIRVSARTVRRYMPKRPAGRSRGDQRWSTFLRNYSRAIVACDFFVAATATFRMFYVLVLIEHGSWRLLHFNLTQHPSAEWTCSSCSR